MKKMCADCDYKEWGAMPYSQQPKLIRCQTVCIVKVVLFIGLPHSVLWH